MGGKGRGDEGGEGEGGEGEGGERKREGRKENMSLFRKWLKELKRDLKGEREKSMRGRLERRYYFGGGEEKMGIE